MKSLDQMMSDLQKPAMAEAHARYENARIATDKAYKIASDHFAFNIGDDDEVKVRIDKFVKAARLIKVAIEEDLNNAIVNIKVDDAGKPS